MAEHRPQRIESVGRQARAPSWGGRLGEPSAFSRERRAGSKERWKGGGERDAKKTAIAFRCRCCRSAAAAVPPPSLLLTESKPLLPLRLDPGQRRRRRGGKRGERGDDGLL